MFHARHYRVPSKVPNGPSSRILLAARSSSPQSHARLFDSAVRFGISAGGAARLWCSTTIFFAKIYQFRVGFGNLYGDAFSPLGVGVLLALFACSTLCSAHLLGGLFDSAARKTVTSIGLFGSTARSTTLATPPCIRFGIRHQNRAERGTLV